MIAKASPQSTPMNRTEQQYAFGVLEVRRLAGEIIRWDFEPVKLKLAPSTFYTPDFRVIVLDWTQEFHEVKGFLRDDAMVKIKVAAEIHPYRFLMVKRVKGGFTTFWESPRTAA